MERLPKKNKNMENLIKFLNTPLGIWFLSTIVVGSLSFAYKNWREKLEDKKEYKEQLNKIDDEIDFRIRHVDRILLNAKVDLEKYDENEITSKDELREILEDITKITAIFDLGGIINIAQDKNAASYKVKSNPMEVRFLPFKSTYKNPALATYSLEDLLNKYSEIKFPKRKDKVALDFTLIENIVFNPKDDLIKENRVKYDLSNATLNQKINKTSKLNNEITEIKEWCDSIHDAWEQIKIEINKSLKQNA